jgi:hypothetical protein
MFGSSWLHGFLLMLLCVGAAHAAGPADSKQSTESFAESRDQIIRWASGFVAKKRNSITGFVKPETPSGVIYHYVDERIIFGKTAKNKEECALHLGRRLESGEWAFDFYLESKTPQAGSVSIIHEDIGDVIVSLEGDLVIQSRPTVSNIGAVTTLDLHTTATSMSLLSLDVYTSAGLGEKSLSILLDDEDNIIQITCRFINSVRIRDGRRVDPVTCYFDHVS